MTSSLINLNKLEEILPKFELYLNGEGIKYLRERKKVNDFLKVYFFEEEAIDSLDKEILKKLVNNLWSLNDCTDKEYIVDEMLRSGLGVIREKFKLLINENEPLAKRFDEMNNNVRMVDEAVISEILSHYNKNKYAVWSRKVLNSLVYLEVSADRFSNSKSQIDGKEYELYCQLIQDIAYEVSNYYPQVGSAFNFNCLLFFVASKDYVYAKQNRDVDKKEEKQHNDINMINTEVVTEQVLQLGSELGFEVDDDIRLTSKYVLDAIWRSKIANIVITYAFEVLESDVNIRFTAAKIADVMRIDPSIQKVIIISSYSQFENLKEKLSEYDISKKSISYFNVNDLNRALSYLESLKEILDDMGLLKFNT